MGFSVPDYIETRIRSSIPANCCVVPGSTPVVSFGDVQKAKVATLGINPSCMEFQDKGENELLGASRRFATLRSLGVGGLESAPTEVVLQVLDKCNGYFCHNPYKKWFNQLEPILKQCGASYYDGSACHLDLIQWATNPTWRGLSIASRNELLNKDVPFLMDQLHNENISLLLVNGKSVLRELGKFVRNIEEVNSIRNGYGKTRMFLGNLGGRLRIIAWSTNIQSSFGVTKELRIAIANHAAELAKA